MIDTQGSLREIQYGDGVYYDVTNGVAGTIWPIGTRAHPSNTIANVLTLCARYHTNVIYVRGALTLGAAMDGYIFIGVGNHTDDVITLNGQTIDDAVFRGVRVTGAQALSRGYFYDCTLDTITTFQGEAYDCVLATSMTLLDGAYTSLFENCHSEGAFTLTVNQHTVTLHAWDGILTVATVNNAGSVVNIYGENGAPVTLAASCTLGTINLYGEANVTDTSGGSTVNNYAFDLAVADATNNNNPSDVIGTKTDAPKPYMLATASQMAYLKAQEARGMASIVGVCDVGMVASTTTIVSDDLVGYGDDTFNTGYQMLILKAAAAPGVAPEMEMRDITDYTSASGTFITAAFSANVQASDVILVIQNNLAAQVVAYGIADAGSTATIIRDAARTEGNDYWNGSVVVMLSGSSRGQSRPIADFVAASDDITVSPDFTAVIAAGDVYAIMGQHSQIAPAADSTAAYLPSQTIGNKADVADYTAGAATSSAIAFLKGILGTIVLAEGTFTTSSATVPADTGRTEETSYFDGKYIMPLTGVAAFQPKPIRLFTSGTDVFTLDEQFTTAPGLVTYVILSSPYPMQRLLSIQNTVDQEFTLAQAFNTTTTAKAASVTLFALDALTGAKKDIRVEFWLTTDAAATFTPEFYVTRQGAPVTFVGVALPAATLIVTPAAAGRYRYEYGDLPEGAQLEFRVAQDNAGNATNAIDAVLTYLG